MLCGIDLSCASARQSHPVHEPLVGPGRASTAITFVIDRCDGEGILPQGEAWSCPYTITFTRIVLFVAHVVVVRALFSQTVQVTSTHIATEESAYQHSIVNASAHR